MKILPGEAMAPVRRKPGRPMLQPAQKDQMRDRILDGAEELFAEFGFAATSFRDIARRVQINPALIGYYFGTKRALFNEVYKRRGKELTNRWKERLDALESQPHKMTAEQLVRAFLEPQFELKAKCRAFVQLQTRVHSEVSQESFALRREVYDEQAKRFIAMLERALPHLDANDVISRFIYCIGASLYMIADVDRSVDLSGGRVLSKSTDEVIERLTRYCTAGMVAKSTFERKRSAPKARPRKAPRKAAVARTLNEYGNNS
ncbi:MAG TPA: TetR/AcrR family transcriptional regulator [Steroidobacteraceae bacterium]|nr:TetR/AcrR family transcriptional regulator [Steroidobacteraceae bacterium]